jgi:hypothetical protein
MRLLVLTAGLALLLLPACEKSAAPARGRWFNVPAYFAAEKKALAGLGASVEKTVQWGDAVFTELSDSVNWDHELSLWEGIDLNRAEWAEGWDTTFTRTADGGRFELYESTLEGTPLRRFSLFYNGKGELLVMEADWETENLFTSRRYRLSYQPARGYSVKGAYRHAWEKEKEFEIFAEIRNPAFLNRMND